MAFRDGRAAAQAFGDLRAAAAACGEPWRVRFVQQAVRTRGSAIPPHLSRAVSTTQLTASGRAVYTFQLYSPRSYLPPESGRTGFD